MCPSRMPTEVTTVTRIEGQRGGRGEERDDDRVDTFDEWCPRTEPVGFRFALSPSLSLSLLYSISSVSLFTVKWRNHRDMERLRSHDVNYRPVPRARRQTVESAWQQTSTENYNAA